MEETEVLIVGAGPSGLVLALALAQHGVKSIVLEKEKAIEQDPRGVVIQGDAVRSVYSLGLGEFMDDIGPPLKDLNFHLHDFQQKPFLVFKQQSDWNEQSLPAGILQVQPRFEHALRELVKRSKFAGIRTGCEVVDRLEIPEGVVVEYIEDDAHRSVKGRWLVGADGKTGVVRKRFLEPVGIKQVVGLYEYTGTWIAANLKISLPTPRTHPDFPLWAAGYTPEEVYDIFWPDGWHFCTHPTRATATGRFGPEKDRYWRHEFAIEEDWKEGMDMEEEFWKHLTQSITRDLRSFRGLNQEGSARFPRDCIKILRCRPFTFTQKVASPTWYHNRTIIIGDASHVFPPFGGQGIACGIRDAMGLAWRLGLLLHHDSALKPLEPDRILAAWNDERRKGIDDAVAVTMTNGRIVNQKNSVLVFLQVLIGRLMMSLPALMTFITAKVFRNDLGYKSVKNGFFLPNHGGGGKLSQVYMKRSSSGIPFLSDEVLTGGKSLFTLIAIVDDKTTSETEKLNFLLDACGVGQHLLSRQSVVLLNSSDVSEEEECQRENQAERQVHYLCSENEIRKNGVSPISGYDEKSYVRRLGQRTRYAIVRPDCVIFSVSRSIEELNTCLSELEALLR